MTDISSLQAVQEISGDTAGEELRASIENYRPLVLRKLVPDWPLVRAAGQGEAAVQRLLAPLDTGMPVDTMVAKLGTRKRFFYSDDMRGFNYTIEKLPLRAVLNRIAATAADADMPALYAGAAPVERHAPEFAAAHRLPLDTPGAVPRLWVGSASQVSTHYDLSENIAVVGAGRRRFLLFPPEATPDLYVGPLNFTPAGQPVSMVDPLHPDPDRYPRFATAMEKALIAELEPGDAIYIPTLWWHHVEALSPFNVLVNYWYNDPVRGGAFITFIHALQTLRDLPAPQRAAWAGWFDHFVFADDADRAADHLPPHARGIQGAASPQRDEAIRSFVLRALSQP
ncbi:cupin-like domain-containing protein [Stakelama sediminis]|uniref:JmjC domain-containing protein n=1 Tax=Stakelama sediminis TaxID=463200 RepID=A0A840YU89_9SPHN|nr:cupin-like domain-containing protein [Stakelama sediminis]MBB5717198.1 hypothetical protein [Stakelama sediminis]